MATSKHNNLAKNVISHSAGIRVLFPVDLHSKTSLELDIGPGDIPDFYFDV